MGTFSFGPQTIQLIFPAAAVRNEPAYAVNRGAIVLLMNTQTLTDNWALWMAAIPGVFVVLAVVYLLLRQGAHGKLRQAVRVERAALKDLNNACNMTQRSEARVTKLLEKSDTVKPRLLQEAEGALEDARALQKIADDKAQIATNHVRRVIFDEFSPSRHDKLRAKYLPGDVRDNRPFSF